MANDFIFAGHSSAVYAYRSAYQSVTSCRITGLQSATDDETRIHGTRSGRLKDLNMSYRQPSLVMFVVKQCVILGWLGFGTLVFAQKPITITGTSVQSIQTTTPQQHVRSLRLQAFRLHPKPVSLLKLRMTEDTKKNLAQRFSVIEHSPKATLNFRRYPRRVQLGMNGVPVLDQGEHGTCMLFATTAALDAALGKGDYVSQLCQLDLNQYLNHHAYVDRGWEGGWGQEFFTQIMMFGIVPKTVQAVGGCAGRLEYPLSGDDITDELSVFDYHQIAEPIQDYGVSIVPLILEEQINFNYIERDHILYQIKDILHRGDRVTCSMLLMGQDWGDINPTASYHVAADTWALLPQMDDALTETDQVYGHAFVITGYDDDAVARDASGKMHRGLLTLRNSWGETVGDQGDFYMTYSYFKAALLEAHRIKHKTEAY